MISNRTFLAINSIMREANGAKNFCMFVDDQRMALQKITKYLGLKFGDVKMANCGSR